MTSVTSPYAPGAISRDGRIAFATVTLDEQAAWAFPAGLARRLPRMGAEPATDGSQAS